MTKYTKALGIDATKTIAAKATPPSKQQQVIDMLSRENGAPLKEMSDLVSWLPHSTRAFMTGLKKKEYNIESDKADGVRRYRIASSPAGEA
jgi:Protein of unknown function (DUF3489)